jgi:DNA-binding NarL/FixJ family response regulator
VKDYDSLPTKILVIDEDESSFQIRQCIAKALHGLPPVEMYHAHDATEALAMIERLCPHVILVDYDQPEERELFIDSLSSQHPPIVLETEGEFTSVQDFSVSQEITYIPRSESLEEMHQELLLVAALGVKYTGMRNCISEMLH